MIANHAQPCPARDQNLPVLISYLVKGRGEPGSRLQIIYARLVYWLIHIMANGCHSATNWQYVERNLYHSMPTGCTGRWPDYTMKFLWQAFTGAYEIGCNKEVALLYRSKLWPDYYNY